MNENRNVLTIATGRPIYLELAINLARSFKYWNRANNISFYLATDSTDALPADVLGYVNLIHLNQGAYGEGFSTKLFLDKIAPPGNTLFIDSDCLIYGPLDGAFDKFKGHPVSVIGTFISVGEWFGDIAAICKQAGVTAIPKFNGGIYYLEKGDMAEKVYQKARELEERYDELGFVRLRERPNDEVLMALSMALNDQKPIIDDGTIMSDPQACRGKYKVDVLKGYTCLINEAYPHPLHQSWYPFYKVSPSIVHFLGYYTSHHPYRLDAYLLRIAAEKKNLKFYRWLGVLGLEYPSRLKEFFKNSLRPVYRLLVGTRPLKKSDRIQ